MLIKRFLLWCSVLGSVVSCTERDDKIEPTLPSQYTSRKLVRGFLSIQGGFVDGNDLFTFGSPFYGEGDMSNPLIGPAMYKVTGEGAISPQYTFEQGYFALGTFPYSPTTRAGSFGKHPLGIRVDLVKTSKGEIFASNKADPVLSVTKILPRGSPCDLALNGVIALSPAAGDTLYALTSQTYYQVNPSSPIPAFELLEPMKIWKIAPDCSISEHYRFPASFTYYVGGGYMGSAANEWTPVENEADMRVTQAGDVLISLMLSGNVYRLGKDKTLRAFITTVDSPSGITTDKYDNVYVVSAAGIREKNGGGFETTKPAQIYRVVKQRPEMIYQGALTLPFAESYYYVPELNKWYVSDTHYNINVTQDLKIFLEDYVGGEITSLQ